MKSITYIDALNEGLAEEMARDPSVFVIENRNLYYKKEFMPEGELTVPIGEAEIVQEGSDVTVVTVGAARGKALAAVR